MQKITATLREITEAIATVREEGSARPWSEDDRARLYSRARTMRDRGLIKTHFLTSQGKEARYTAADIAAAVVAINVSLNGGSAEQIEVMNGSLRTFNNTRGVPAFENNLNLILAGVPVFIRYDISSHPWPSARARMGAFNDLGLTGSGFEWLDGDDNRHVITQTTLYPVTTLVLPVFKILAPEEDE